jgi:hypothetical protein
MKQAAAGVALAGSIAGLAYYQGNASTALFEVDDVARTQFDEHLAEYGKSYGTKEEYEFRLKIFQDNLVKIAEHNQKNADDAVWGVNYMVDWTPAEYKRLLGFKAHTMGAGHHGHRRHGRHGHHGEHHGHHGQHERHERRKLAGDLPASLDWREKGAVTPVKNQGACGSCWSFSATGAMEGAYFLKNNDLKSFSEQQLVDCSRPEGNEGCNGGLMDSAFTYAKDHKMETESEYPYTGRDGKCHADGGVAELSAFADVTPKDPEALAEALQKGPVAIAVDAGGLQWQLYFGGIIKHLCGDSLDHGVLLVGYGTDRGTDYWLVKNSWGASWGEHGYLRIKRDMTKKEAGVCGLQLQPSQPEF